MSQPSETLLKVRAHLDTILAKRDEGTADNPRSVTRIDTAYQRALDRAGGGQLPADGQRGGSSNPDDANDRREADRVKRQAEKDAWDIGILTARMVKDAAMLRQITDRQAEVIHESKLPVNVLPGCRSCARKEERDGQTAGGHWAPVSDKGTAAADGLCRQCYEFKLATGGLPPIVWCHMMHTVGTKQANKWLAREFPKLLESVQRKQKNEKVGITAEDLELRPGNLITHRERMNP